ncbi:uncharacterized protein BXZ73DRAFT_75131 [Epithele typhae]|uniref:uncharacterized protein n=1 Tax=Epithele typhae TaxID=378194 RepID=UPI002007B642|nr:uncharacterized protein BXZ73DRAFT_75131 [Epithele typhae]KAH9941164.1 hypothetical protein BXZ73DRAFT_75131 [Epithele typhae]
MSSWLQVTCGVPTPGSLSGLWAGHHLDPDVDGHALTVHSYAFDARLENPFSTVAHALFFDVREHYCMSPAQLLPLWEPSDATDEGALNTYAVHMRRQGMPKEWVYKTYMEGERDSHEPETCKRFVANREEEEAEVWAKVAEILVGRVAECDADENADRDVELDDDHDHDHEMGKEHGGAARIDRVRQQVQDGLDMDIDELIDTISSEDNDKHESEDAHSCVASPTDSDIDIERTCSGIKDIFITSETPARYAQAWRAYMLYRVCPWDGLVVLVRVQIPPAGGSGSGPPTVYRGYRVGAWRHASASANTVLLEDTFVVSKVYHPPASAGEDAGTGTDTDTHH